MKYMCNFFVLCFFISSAACVVSDEKENISSKQNTDAQVKNLRAIRPAFSGLPNTKYYEVEDIMALGQLGGTLYPTSRPSKNVTASIDSASNDKKIFTDKRSNSSKGKEKSSLHTAYISPKIAASLGDLSLSNQKDTYTQNALFGKAMEEWNLHNYSHAYQMLGDYLTRYPNGIWAGEAALHQGCDARFKGRYREAGRTFESLIEKYEQSPNLSSQLLAEKAKSRMAVLRLMENNPIAAHTIFAELAEKGLDWRQRTYAQGWLQRISSMQHSSRALANCGTRALGKLLADKGDITASLALQNLSPDSDKGFSLKELKVLAQQYNYDVTPLNTTVNDLANIPLPAIAQVDRDDTGGAGHYWIIEQADDKTVVAFDEQSQRRFRQTHEEFKQEWGGNLLVFNDEKRSTLPGTLIDDAQADQIFGGCCGLQRPVSNLGSPYCNGKSPGCPSWRVNRANMNLYVTDMPLWYATPYGPDVEINLSYNSLSATAENEIFGNKWIFSYSSYVVEDPGQNVTVFMPDGRRAIYMADNNGGFEPTRTEVDQLSKAGDTYTLRTQDGMIYTYAPPAGTASQQVFLTQLTAADGYSLTFNYDTQARLNEIVDAQGRKTILAYNTSNKVTLVTDPFGRTARFGYDNNLNLTSLTDMSNFTSDITYDENVFVTSITKPEQGTWTFYIEPADGIMNGTDYPAPGDDMWEHYRITVTDPENRITEHFYEGHDGVSMVTFPRDYKPYVSDSDNNARVLEKTKFTHQGNTIGRANMIHHTRRDGNTTFAYDNHGNTTQVTDTRGMISKHTYNATHQLEKTTLAFGTTLEQSTNYEYVSDRLSLPTKIISPPLASGRHLETSIEYNPRRKPERIVLAEKQGTTAISERVSTISYNTQGLPTLIDGPRTDVNDVTRFTYYDCSSGVSYCGQLNTVENALGHITTFSDYTQEGKPGRITTPNGIDTTYAYDNLGRITRVTEGENASGASPRITQFSYLGPKQLKTVTLPIGLTLTLSYNRAGDVTAIENNVGDRIEYTLDSNGNAEETVTKDANGVIRQQVKAAYDMYNRVVASIGAQNQTSAFKFDGNDNLTLITDAMGLKTKQDFDKLNRPKTVTDADNKKTHYEYNVAGLVTKVTDAIGRATTYRYNVFGDLLETSSPDNGISTYTYDLAGNLSSETDARSITRNFTYDVLNRMSLVGYPNSSENISYTYDNPPLGVGLLYSINDESGVTTYQYNDFAEVKEDVRVIAGQRFVTEYQYHQGLLKEMTYPSGLKVNYHFNTLGQVTRVDSTLPNGSPQVLAEDIGYLPFGSMKNLRFGNGLTLAQEFDLDYRLKRQHSSNVSDRTYAYTPRNNIESIKDTLDTHVNRDFVYDKRERLGAALSNEDAEAFGYDAIGNRVAHTEFDSFVKSYQYSNGRLNTMALGEPQEITWRTRANAYRGQYGKSMYFFCPPVTNGYPYYNVNGTDIYNDESNICGAAVHAGIFPFDAGGKLILIMRPPIEESLGSLRYGVNSGSTTFIGGRDAFSVFPAPGNDYVDRSASQSFLQRATERTDMISYRGYTNGESFHFHCPANVTIGHVAGTDTYADSSRICSVAIHQGLISQESGGIFRVQLAPPEIEYEGSTENGVTSIGWRTGNNTPWPGNSIKLSATSSIGWHNTGNDRQAGFCSPNGTLGLLNGTFDHAMDSSVCTAAVHAGAITAEYGGFASYSIDSNGQDSFLGSTRHGVTSTSAGAASESFRISRSVMSDISTPVFTYDASGNITGYADKLFTYNQAGRLVTFNNTTDSAIYQHNAQGQRVSKTLNSVTTYFIYDQAGQLIAEADGLGTISTNYVYLNNQRLAQINGNSVYYIHTDHLGSSVALSDSAGTIKWRANQKAFGEVSLSVSDITHNLRFSGQYYDLESDTHYNYFRTYDPEVGRYLQSDPIGLAGGINTYAYVGGNPLTRYDPDGRAWVQIFGGVIGGFVGAYNASQQCNSTFGSILTAGLIGTAVGAASTLGAGPWATAFFAGGSAAAGNAVQQALSMGSFANINRQQVVSSGLTGAALGVFTAGIGKGLAPRQMTHPGTPYTVSSTLRINPGQAQRMLPRRPVYRPDPGVANPIDLGANGLLSYGASRKATQNSGAGNSQCGCGP